MKIVLTGSLGHISKTLAVELIAKGNSVTLISSKPEKKREIEALGAEAAIGNIDNVDFLTSAFADADIVYCMVPYPDTTQPIQEILNAYIRKAENYKLAIERTGIKKVVNLSSVAADMQKGNGLLQYAYEIEQVFNKLPEDISIKFIRPVSFYYNVLTYIPQIKKQGMMMSNYGGETKKPWVSPIDIAAATSAAICSHFNGREISYIASEELSCHQIAQLLGTAIGRPDLKWVTISDDAALKGFIQAGMEPSTAKAFTEMNAGIQDGRIYKDYYKHQPVLGKVKFRQYAEEFAQIFNQ